LGQNIPDRLLAKEGGTAVETHAAGFSFLGLLTVAAAFASQARAAGEEKVPLMITGGHETDPRDRGRPVAVVAGALGVTADVFRKAFSQVRPAPVGTEPEPAQVRRNKEVLFGALKPYGVTNDELDRVSDFYRYVPGRGRLWPVKAAAGYALFKDGAFQSIAITDPGYGYNASPNVSVPGHPELSLKATLAFGRDLRKNGSIATIAQVKAEHPSR
jgi:hypothetical protein